MDKVFFVIAVIVFYFISFFLLNAVALIFFVEQIPNYISIGIKVVSAIAGLILAYKYFYEAPKTPKEENSADATN